MKLRRKIREFKENIHRFFLRRELISQIKKLQGENVFSPPLAVSMETTNYCNGNCSFCPYGLQKHEKPKQAMPPDLSSSIIRQCAELQIRTLDFTGFNEPLTDEKLTDRIKYAKAQGVEHTMFYTNGSLLDNKVSRELILSGLDEIHISVDGLCKAAYRRIRQGLIYDVVRNNVESFKQARDSLNMSKPKVYLNVALNKQELELDKTEHANSWRAFVDEIVYVPIIRWAYECVKEKGHIYPCHSLWHTMLISVDAKVYLCCMDFEKKFILGDLNKSSIMDIWNSEKLAKIRKAHLDRFRKREFYCDACHWTKDVSNWRFMKGINI
ncbi:MAG: radical SAM/SPASM domain-containing protein [Candidatus Omnitrophota bacterium]